MTLDQEIVLCWQRVDEQRLQQRQSETPAVSIAHGKLADAYAWKAIALEVEQGSIRPYKTGLDVYPDAAHARISRRFLFHATDAEIEGALDEALATESVSIIWTLVDELERRGHSTI